MEGGGRMEGGGGARPKRGRMNWKKNGKRGKGGADPRHWTPSQEQREKIRAPLLAKLQSLQKLHDAAIARASTAEAAVPKLSAHYEKMPHPDRWT